MWLLLAFGWAKTLDMSNQQFTTIGSIIPEETFGIPSQLISQENIVVKLEPDGVIIGGNQILYADVKGVKFQSLKSLLKTTYSLTLSDGANTYILRIPDKQIAKSFPYQLDEINTSFWSGDKKVIKKGIIHGLGVSLLTILTFYIAFHYFNFDNDKAEKISGLTYMASIFILGFIWKKRNGITMSFSNIEATINLLRYAFGMAIVVVFFSLFAMFDEISAFGQWWPLFMIILVPFALFAQTAHISVMTAMGGWFCRITPDKENAHGKI